MDLSGISPESVFVDRMAATRRDFAIQVLRKAMDIDAAQGAALVQMMAQSTGVGANVDISA